MFTKFVQFFQYINVKYEVIPYCDSCVPNKIFAFIYQIKMKICCNNLIVIELCEIVQFVCHFPKILIVCGNIIFVQLP